MRVFVLTTGRSGSTTVANACSHITNYTSAHESRTHLVKGRLTYPDNHIEVDNKLAWFLGTLDHLYGDDAIWVHLTRDPDKTAESYAERFTGHFSIINVFGNGILRTEGKFDRLEVSRLIIDTVNDNIEMFLRDKTRVVHMSLPDLRPGFDTLWKTIGAEGDLKAAQQELTHRYNRRRKKRRK